MAEGQRLDKWLWVARFFKSRSLATEAVQGGKVYCNSERSKPGKAIKPGDKLRIRKGIYEYDIVIDELSPRRLSAPEAQKLYTETQASEQARELKQQQYRAERLSMPVAERRPNKRDRRKLLAIKNRKHD